MSTVTTDVAAPFSGAGASVFSGLNTASSAFTCATSVFIASKLALTGTDLGGEPSVGAVGVEAAAAAATSFGGDAAVSGTPFIDLGAASAPGTTFVDLDAASAPGTTFVDLGPLSIGLGAVAVSGPPFLGAAVSGAPFLGAAASGLGTPGGAAPGATLTAAPVAALGATTAAAGPAAAAPGVAFTDLASFCAPPLYILVFFILFILL